MKYNINKNFVMKVINNGVLIKLIVNYRFRKKLKGRFATKVCVKIRDKCRKNAI